MNPNQLKKTQKLTAFLLERVKAEITEHASICNEHMDGCRLLIDNELEMCFDFEIFYDHEMHLELCQANRYSANFHFEEYAEFKRLIFSEKQYAESLMRMLEPEY